MFYYSSSDFFMMLIFIAIALAVISWMRRRMTSAQKPSASSSTAAKPQSVSKTQMAEDIRATKTSQVVDAVSILDDLGSTSSNYRHYCELVGTSMATSGIIAPYSKREVAYYDIKCYRIDGTSTGGQRETLVAHEHSFDPFFFTDASCDTPVYVDLESFGDNVILVNSTNHIEGPNSDFAKAFQRNAGSATSGSSGSPAYAAIAHVAERGHNLLAGAASTLREALTPHPALQPALAVAGGTSIAVDQTHALGSNMMLSEHRGRGGGRRPSYPPQGQVSVHMGNGGINVHVGPGIPQHLGDFMGPSHQPYVMGGGYTTHRPTGPSSADLLLGMSLGALLNSMTTTQQVVTTNPVDTFRGYRLVESIVPLRSPIYCIGEIYRHGTDVYMSRSLAKDYPTSFFATKPESEVLSAIGGV